MAVMSRDVAAMPDIDTFLVQFRHFEILPFWLRPIFAFAS